MEAESELGSALPGLDPELGSRITQVAAMIGSDQEAARVGGISVDTLSNYEKLRTGPKLEPLLRMAQRANVSVAWLITGRGSMQQEGVGGQDDLVALPRYDVQAAAGAGAVVLSDRVTDWVHFRRDWLRSELGANPRNLAMISAVGDSMAPTIENGDLLIVDVSEKRWTRDGIYVIGVDDELWVKRVDRLPDGGLVLSSDNPRHAHGTATIAKAHISTVRFAGRVAWVGGRV